MKRLAILLAATSLAACSGEPAPEPTPEATETVAAAPTMESMAGTYEYNSDEGSGTSILLVDGTYTDTVGDAVEKGTWTLTDGKTCFDPEGDDPAKPNQCYTVSEADAVGMQTATADDGTVVKIRKTA